VEDEKSTLQGLVERYVEKHSTVCTDCAGDYGRLSDLGYAHLKVNHSRKQYKFGQASTNMIESVWSSFKRGYRIYQKISHKHLRRYADEFAFRWNHSKSTATENLDALVRGAFLGWLPYRELAGGGKAYYVSGEYRRIADGLLAWKKLATE
jgi:hypothetical protein